MEPDVTDHEFLVPQMWFLVRISRDFCDFRGIQVVEVQTGKDDVQEWWK